MRRTLLLCLSLFVTSPALAQLAPMTDAMLAGRTVYAEAGGIGCVACHGAYALGDLGIGPNVRGVDAARIEGALEAAEEMEFLLPLLSDADIEILAAYLGYLGTLEPVTTLFRSGVFDPAELTVVAGAPVQVIVNNGGRSVCTFALEGSELEPVEIAGRSAGDVVIAVAEGSSPQIGRCAEAPDAVLALIVETAAAE